MKVGEIEASLVDLLGYVLPGGILVATSIILNDWSVLGGREVAQWGATTLLMVAGLGYIVGQIFSGFQTQTLGWVSDRCFGHRHDIFIEDNVKLTTLGKSFLGVRPFTADMKMAVREQRAKSQLSLFDLGNQLIAADEVLHSHERRLRAHTIMFGNLVFTTLGVLAIMLVSATIDIYSAIGVAFLSTLCFARYARSRLYRNRFLYRVVIANELQPQRPVKAE